MANGSDGQDARPTSAAWHEEIARSFHASTPRPLGHEIYRVILVEAIVDFSAAWVMGEPGLPICWEGNVRWVGKRGF